MRSFLMRSAPKAGAARRPIRLATLAQGRLFGRVEQVRNGIVDRVDWVDRVD